jgi:hypothetical protein
MNISKNILLFLIKNKERILFLVGYFFILVFISFILYNFQEKIDNTLKTNEKKIDSSIESINFNIDNVRLDVSNIEGSIRYKSTEPYYIWDNQKDCETHLVKDTLSELEDYYKEEYWKKYNINNEYYVDFEYDKYSYEKNIEKRLLKYVLSKEKEIKDRKLFINIVDEIRYCLYIKDIKIEWSGEADRYIFK